MKKKLRLYCGVLAVVLVAAIVCDLVHVSYSNSTDKEREELYFGKEPDDFSTIEEIEGGVRRKSKPTMSIDVNVQARHYPKDFALLSEVDGQVCRVDMKQVSLAIPADRVTQSKPFIITYCSIIPNVLLLGWLVVIVFQVLRSVARKEVFVARIAKKLELAGILLVAFWVWQYIRSYIVTQILVQYVNMAYYDIKWFTPNFICLIMGLALMIVSQIILMGKELQEEQELTI